MYPHGFQHISLQAGGVSKVTPIFSIGYLVSHEMVRLTIAEPEDGDRRVNMKVIPQREINREKDLT